MQTKQNPDVNSTDVDENYPDRPESDVEREPISVPPDVENPYPVTDPPLIDNETRVDADDSRARIAGGD